jgi:hypothetical protein
MKQFTFLIFIFIYLSLPAQNWEWARKADATTSNEGPYSIKTDSLGNVYMFGTGNGGNQYGGTVLAPGTFIVKFDSSGTVIWANNINYSGSGAINLFNVDRAGNIFLAGYFYSTAGIYGFTFTGHGNEDIFMIKLDPSGSPLWGKSFGGSGADMPGSIAFDKDQNIYLDGGFGSYGDSTITFDSVILRDSLGEGQFFLAKFNPSGNTVWATTGDPSFEWGKTMTIDNYSNVYLTAYSGQYYGTFIAKFDSAGNLLFHYLKWGTYDYVPALAVGDSGNIYLLHNGIGHYGFLPILVKYDSLMNEQWSTGIGTYYGCYQFAAGIFLDKSENIYVGGSLGSPYCSNDSVYFHGQLAYVGQNEVPAIAKFDTNGDLLWIQKGAAADYDGIRSMCQSTSGNFYIAGQFNTTTTGDGDTLSFGSNTLLNDGNWAQIFVAKLNILNNKIAVNELSSDNFIRVFPNPSSGIFRIQFHNSEHTIVSVYNMLGKCVLAKDCSGKDNQQIDLSDQAKGLYFIEIVSEGKRSVKKVVCQ